MKELIENIHYHNQDEIIGKLKNWFGELSKVTVFFDNENFLITDYTPLSLSVHTILEDNKHNELHIQDCNCGYSGTGPSETVRLLKKLGLQNEEKEIKEIIYLNDGVQFKVENNYILPYTVNHTICFRSPIRQDKLKIELGGNVHTDIVKRKVIFINPQYHYFFGFLNFLKNINVSTFEYYMGENSPIESYLDVNSLKDARFYTELPNLKGIKHVNLLLKSEDIEIICLVDKANEMQIINAIYLALTNTNLFSSERYDINIKPKNKLKSLLKELFPPKKNRDKPIHDTIILDTEDNK